MNLSELLSDPARELESELVHIDEKRRVAALRNDTGTLNQLTQRKAELPELIRQAKLRDIADQINVQSVKLASFQLDFKNANQESAVLMRELSPKLSELNREIERLKNEALESQAVVEALRFTVGHEEKEMENLKQQRQALLLSPLTLTTAL